MANKEEHCLLVKTVDNRHFFTALDNFPQLIEFSKAQNAEVSVVKPHDPVRVLTLPDLAKSLCDPNYNVFHTNYELIEKRIGVISNTGSNKLPRQKLIAQAREIREHIEKVLMDGKQISLENLGQKFAEYNLGDAAIRKHLTFVRLKLAKDGYAVSKVSVGTYKLHKE